MQYTYIYILHKYIYMYIAYYILYIYIYIYIYVYCILYIVYIYIYSENLGFFQQMCCSWHFSRSVILIEKQTQLPLFIVFFLIFFPDFKYTYFSESCWIVASFFQAFLTLITWFWLLVSLRFFNKWLIRKPCAFLLDMGI